jgi:hypothetical protein
MLALAPAAAQPPADSERYPPASELPGTVVSMPSLGQPIQELKEPAKEAVPTEMPAPQPAKHDAPPAETPCLTVGPVCKPCHSGCFDKLKEWLMFRSRARQSGHYPSPYTPPLHAWFPCDPNHKSCGPAGPVKVPGWAPPGPMPPPKPVEVGPSPSVIPPGAEKSDPSTGIKQIDAGLSFSPGGAPMAAPTTQTEKVSTWRPR